jgi:tRNA pseudouridine38-40 synthase
VRAYRIAYDGRPFYGFQRQPDVPTVEDALLSALDELGVAFEGDTPSGYAAAGRTDSGVSALAQTVAFDAPEWLTPAAFDSELPADIRAWASADAPEGFHATHDADARTYTYVLHAPGASLDRGKSACRRLSGEHDFHNLTPDDTGTVRDLELTAEREGACLVLTVAAGGFARQLVRRLVSVVREVATDEAGIERIDRVLGAESLPGPEGVPPAPAHGLVLTDVSYPSLSFRADADGAESVREVFGDRASEWVVRARVARTISEGVDPE